MKIVVFSALPHEYGLILKDIRPLTASRLGTCRIFSQGLSDSGLTVVETGTCAKNAEAAFEEFIRAGAPDLVVSLGFSGALYEGARPGDLVWAEKALFIPGGPALDIPDNENTFEMLRKRIPLNRGTAVTIGQWMNKQEVLRDISPGLSFPVCDMETYPLARLSLERAIPFIAIRSVSDTLHEEVPLSPGEVSDGSGFYSLPRTLASILRKPGAIPGIIRLGRNSRTASRSLRDVLKLLLETLGAARPG